MDLKELARFLVKAKKNTYASGIEPSTLGHVKLFKFRDGDFQYEDAYFGFREFEGQELVFHKEELIWTMSYKGGMLVPDVDFIFTSETYAFLKNALSKVSEDRPFRGPDTFFDENYTYVMEITKGDITDFIGREKIFFKGKEVYALSFEGRLLKNE